VLFARLVLAACLVGGSASAADRTLERSDADRSAEMLAAAKDAEASGDLERADREYHVLLGAFPDQAVGWAEYGEFQRFLVHDAGSARVAFTKALNVSDSSDRARACALRGLGYLASAEGDHERAIALMQQSLAVTRLADTHRSLSVELLVGRGDTAGAAEQARLAVELAPDQPLTLLVYAILSQRLGHETEGREAYDRALDLAGLGHDAVPHGTVHCCVMYNAACYLAVRGDREGSLKMLAAFFNAPNHRHRTRAEIEGDPDFASLVHDPDFTALLDANAPKE
jgi:Tfp pilus assembly protein PilF